MKKDVVRPCVYRWVFIVTPSIEMPTLPDGVRRHSRKCRARGAVSDHSRHRGGDQIDDIAADQRQVDNLIRGKHRADRGRRRRQQWIGCGGHFDRLCDVPDLQCEILTDTLRSTQTQTERLSLKPGQRGC